MTHCRRVAHVLLAALLAVGVSIPLLAAPAAAAVPGYVRLAHLSPDTPRVDVTVTSFRGRDYSKLFSQVGYGAMSGYQRLSAGSYTVTMRPPGESKKGPSVIRGTITVSPGKAYTVAGVGRNAQFSLRVINDDFDQPGTGKARMRVIQAASTAPVVDVHTNGGDWMAQAVRFPSTTPYSDIDAQKWTLRADAKVNGVEPDEQTVDVKPGIIYTALVLDRGSGLKLVVKPDAAASASSPVGGVDAGYGGGARSGGSGLPPETLLVAFALAVLVAMATWTKSRARG